MIGLIDGDKQALEDWKNRRAVKLVKGNINADKPIIDESGFYLGGCSKGAKFVSDYNKTIKKLVDDYGIPDWAPGSRVLSEGDIQDLISNSSSFPYKDLPEKKDRNLIRNRMLIWRDLYGKEPSGNAYIESRSIYVLWDEVGDNLIIDVMDLSHGVWMQTFEVPISVPEGDIHKK